MPGPGVEFEIGSWDAALPPAVCMALAKALCVARFVSPPVKGGA